MNNEDLLAAVDALRGALGDNPCVLLSGDSKDRYYFSDPDLEAAIRKIMPLIPTVKHSLTVHTDLARAAGNAYNVLCDALETLIVSGHIGTERHPHLVEKFHAAMGRLKRALETAGSHQNDKALPQGD